MNTTASNTPEITTREKEAPPMSNLKSLIAQLTGRERDQAKAAADAADLKLQIEWARGEERRQRLGALAGEARQLSERAADTTSEIAAAAQQVTTAIRTLTELVDAHNAALTEISAKISAEGVRNSVTPPSPADGGVGVNGGHVIIGDEHIVPLNGQSIVTSAVTAADQTDTVPTVPPAVVHQPLAAGRFWINRDSGSAFVADQQPYNCVELSRVEYLAHHWGLKLAELPESILAGLSDVERAKVAPRLLDELADDQRAQFADALLPRKASA
jgi:hypothetical protein